METHMKRLAIDAALFRDQRDELADALEVAIAELTTAYGGISTLPQAHPARIAVERGIRTLAGVSHD